MLTTSALHDNEYSVYKSVDLIYVQSNQIIMPFEFHINKSF